VVNNWGDWGPCNKDCGDGVRARSRAVATPATFGGLSCPPLVQTSPCPGLQPCDYLAKLRNLKDRIRRLELQRRVEYLEHLHLLAKARQILFPPTLPVSSTAAGSCGLGGCVSSSAAAGTASSSSATYIPPPAPPRIIKQPVVYIIDRPYVVDRPFSSSAKFIPHTTIPPSFSSSAVHVPCSDGGCVEADVVNDQCCPGHCCAPPPPKDLVEAIAVDHLDNCCDHASPHISCCVLPPPQTCCHWPSPHQSCCTEPTSSVPQPPTTFYAGPTNLDINSGNVDSSNSDDSSNSENGDSCCHWTTPQSHCCSSFRQQKVSSIGADVADGAHVYPGLTDTEQLESITDFLQTKESQRKTLQP